ncbi:MAG: adenylate/guanylate cyclase domain-containing protein [Alphaproteobacteria bacterium]|nr:adenylate/guanylate cyclase domain-containing protein [Alphaproteobacteria bacterium]
MIRAIARLVTTRNLLRYGLPLVILFVLSVLYVERPLVVERAQLTVFDTFQRLRPRVYEPDVPVRIVDIDDESLTRIGQWPWPRTRVALLVEKLAEMGAAVVAFDIVFAEPDRTSPAQTLPMWPKTPEIQTLLKDADRLPDHDRLLAQAMRHTRAVTGFVLTAGSGGRRPLTGATFAWGGPDALPWIPSYSGAVTSLPVLEEAAAGNGSFNMAPGIDGLIRRVPLVVRTGETSRDGHVYASLVIEALRVAQGARTVMGKTAGGSGELSFGERTGIVQMRVGRLNVPTDKNGALVVYYTGHRQQRFMPAWKVMDGSIDRSEIEGRIIFIGTSAAGLMDLRSTPMDTILPGVEVHVEAVEQILAQEFLYRPDWAPGIEIMMMLALGLGIMVLIPLVGALGSAIVGAGAIAAAVGASWYAFVSHHYQIDPFFPAFGTLAVYLAESLISFLQVETERRQVRQAFQQYMSPALLEQLAANPERLKLGGETKRMTILFSDVRGFTSISEQFKANPQGLTELMNRLLTPLTDVILRHDGTIDKYMGDAVMAFWNAPLDVPDHADKAIESALDMFAAMERLNRERAEEARAAGGTASPLAVGIGINTGDCVVGNMGSKQRFDYSVLGDAVNLASRLEGQSKNYGVGLVIGRDTVAALKGEYALLELDLIAVKGKNEGVAIYTALGRADRARDTTFRAAAQRHAAMLAAYRGMDWAGAERILDELRGAFGGAMDNYYAEFHARIAGFRADPPAPGWDGVYRATSK